MEPSPLAARHAALGARLLGDLPLTFGNVPAEYAAGHGGAALFDETRRGAVDVRGKDAVDFLHRILANRVRELAPGEGARNLLLSSKGKVEHLFDLARTEDGCRLSTAPGDAPKLIAALDRYHFAEALRFEDQSAQSAPLALFGPAADGIVAALFGLGAELSRGAFADRALGSLAVRLSRVAVAGCLGWRAEGGPEGAEALWDALVAAGATPIGKVAYDCLRVEAGQAEAGEDVDNNVYPQEARLEDAFSLAKGCYIGQEVVAKIDTYGGLNKRLVLVAVDHDDPLPRGTRLWGGDEEPRELGLVTTWAYSFQRDSGLCLAYVKRRHQRVGTEFALKTPEGADLAGRATIVTMPQRPGVLAPTGEFE